MRLQCILSVSLSLLVHLLPQERNQDGRTANFNFNSLFFYIFLWGWPVPTRRGRAPGHSLQPWCVCLRLRILRVWICAPTDEQERTVLSSAPVLTVLLIPSTCSNTLPNPPERPASSPFSICLSWESLGPACASTSYHCPPPPRPIPIIIATEKQIVFQMFGTGALFASEPNTIILTSYTVVIRHGANWIFFSNVAFDHINISLINYVVWLCSVLCVPSTQRQPAAAGTELWACAPLSLWLSPARD